MNVAAPQIPPAGTELDARTAARLAAELDTWVAEVASDLFDLETDAQASGTPQRSADIAAAFELWRAVSARAAAFEALADATGGHRADVLAEAWRPVTADNGATLAANLPDAIAFLEALVTRLEQDVADAHRQAATAATAWLDLDRDLTEAGRAAARLGQEVRHVADLVAEAKGRSRAIAPPPELLARAHEARARLDAAELERERLLTRLDASAATLAELERKEAAVRTLATTCRAKIADAPTLAVPSVAAIDAPPADARDRPWSAVHAVAANWVRVTERASAALDEAARRFQAPLTRRDELRGLLQAFRDKADSAHLAEHESLDPRYQAARATLWSAPCDLATAEAQVADYVRTINTMMHGVN